MTLNVPLTTPADPSRSLRITPFIPCHYDAFRSPLLVTCFPKIVILTFRVTPSSQYPPSGFAGHLLINKEAYPIPILPVRIPFLNTVANLLLALWMTPYRIPSFRAEVRMLYEKTGRRLCHTERRIYYSDDTLPFPSLWRLAVRCHSDKHSLYKVIFL